MSYANLLLNVLYHIVMEMKIRESCLQSGTFIYKPGISVTKQDFHLQMGSLGLQMGFSGYYLPLELAKGKYIEFPNVEYREYYLLQFNNVDERERKLALTVQTIGDGIAQIENDISNPAQKIDDMYFRKKNSCITITNIAFIISEAARFEFVRDTVKRIYGYLSNDEITQIYLNPKSSGRWYNYRPYYRDLLDHYSKIAIASNKWEKNLHNEMLTVDECREYYSDTVKFPDDYPNLEDLRKIGLIERK